MTRATLLLLLLLLAKLPCVLAQDPSVLDRAAARFDRGLDLVRQGDYVQAGLEFEGAYQLSASPTVLCNAGMAFAVADRSAEAVAALTRCVEESKDSLAPTERARFKEELELQRPRVSTFMVELRPTGAVLVVDDHAIGRSPLPQPLFLAPGVHRFEASRAGYEPVVREVTTLAQQNATLRIDLRPATSAAMGPALLPLRCGVPDVDIWFDDRLVGTSPETPTVATASGSHLIRFRREGYLETILPVLLEPALAAPLDCALRILPELPDALAATLQVRDNSHWMYVRVDEQLLPSSGRIPSGRHRIEVNAPGHEPWTETVLLAAGEQRVVDVRTKLTTMSPEELARRRRRRAAYVLGISGLATGIAALITYLVADAQHADWQRRDGDLRVAYAQYDEQADPHLAYQHLLERQAENNQQLQSVWRLDKAALALGVASGLLLTATAVTFVSARSRDQPRSLPIGAAFGPTGVRVDAHF